MADKIPIIPRLLSVAQAAEYLGRTPEALRQLIHRGRLPVVKLDRRVQVDRLDLDEIISKSKQQEVG